MKANPHETNRKIWLSAAAGFALMVLAVCPQQAVAQNTFPGSGNAGVGTTSPPSILTVQTTGPDSTGDKYLRVKNTNSFTGLLLDPGQAGDAGWLLMGGYPNAGDFTIRQFSFANHLTIKKDSGNVGLGAANPYTRLTTVGVSGEPTLTHNTAAIASFLGASAGNELVVGASSNSPYSVWSDSRACGGRWCVPSTLSLRLWERYSTTDGLESEYSLQAS